MFRTFILTAAAATTLASAALAADVNLRPGFNVKTGTLYVKNDGTDGAGRTLATVGCKGLGGASCPDPAAADIAPYENPAFPNVATVKFKPIGGMKTAKHTFPFYAGLAWAPGKYVLTVCVDAGNHQAETNEGDNCRRFIKTVKGPVAATTKFKARN